MSIAQAQTVLEKIRTRGYWRVVIRPATFEENHIPNDSDLFQIVEKNIGPASRLGLSPYRLS